MGMSQENCHKCGAETEAQDCMIKLSRLCEDTKTKPLIKQVTQNRQTQQGNQPITRFQAKKKNFK